MTTKSNFRSDNAQDLKRHMNFEHRNRFAYACDQCATFVCVQADLVEHMRQAHFTCTIKSEHSTTTSVPIAHDTRAQTDGMLVGMKIENTEIYTQSTSTTTEDIPFTVEATAPINDHLNSSQHVFSGGIECTQNDMKQEV